MNISSFLRLAGAVLTLQMVACASSAATDNGALANYTVLNSTQFGQSMARQFPASTTARAAVRATVPDLTRYFGAPPKLIAAYQDQNDQKSAYVFFSEQLAGQPVNGLAVLQVQDQGTTELIVYCQANAPKGELGKLLAQPSAAATQAAAPAATVQAAAVPVAAAPVSLHTYTFSDNTGSVGLADGWTCNAQDIAGASIAGPADQTISIDAGGQVLTPNGQTFRVQQMTRTLGNTPVGPYSPDPATALKNLFTAISQVMQRNGRPTSTVDQILQVQPVAVDPAVPDGHAAFIIFDSTKTTQGVSKKYRSAIQISVYTLNQGQDSWGYFATEMTAPQETFQQDYPVMLAQFNSLKENSEVIQKNGAQGLATMKSSFAQAAQQVGRQEAAMNQQLGDMNRQELASDRNFDNFDEIIRGTRTVVDTQTGQQADADLSNVNQVVDALNEGDPGRYKAIPLRDQSDPLPGQQ